MDEDLIEKAKYSIPSGEYNDVLEKLIERYIDGETFSEDIMEKLEEYDPYIFEEDEECLDGVISELYPQLLNYNFHEKKILQHLYQQSQYKYILFNALYKINQGKYFEEDINIEDNLPVPDNDTEMFVLCEGEQWITKTINNEHKKTKIALYYDDFHILVSDAVFDENVDAESELRKTNVVFDENILKFMRHLDKLEQVEIDVRPVEDDQHDFDFLMKLYNIPDEFRDGLLDVAEKQNSNAIFSYVGEALRFQQNYKKNFV